MDWDTNEDHSCSHFLLRKACENGNLEEVEKLLEGDTNPDNLDKSLSYCAYRNTTALHIACSRGHLEIVKLLIIKGTDVNAVDLDNKTALHYACESDEENLEIVKILLNFGVDVNAASRSQKLTALQLACSQGYLKISKLLIEKGADLSMTDDLGKNPLYLACRTRTPNLKLIQSLLSLDIDVNAGNKFGETALHIACHYGNSEIVKWLLEKGADPNLLGWNDQNALHYACESWETSLEVVELLINTGIDLNARRLHGSTALHCACHQGHFKIVKMLIENGANINLLGDDNNSILQSAFYTENSNLELVKYLLNLGLDLNARNIYNGTPVHYAFFIRNIKSIQICLEKPYCDTLDFNNKNDLLHDLCSYNREEIALEMIKTLMGLGVDLNSKNYFGETALHIACSKGLSTIVKFLLENGAEFDVLDNCKNTPLHSVCDSSECEILETVELMVNLVNLDARNKYGSTALHLAYYHQHSEVVKLLLEKGINVNILDNKSMNVLHYVCRSWKQDLKLVESLLNLGAEMNVRNRRGKTALHLACRKGHFGIARLLIERGANCYILDNKKSNILHCVCDTVNDDLEMVEQVINLGIDLNAKNSKGQTPLHIACSYGFIDIVKFLLNKGANVYNLDGKNNSVLHYASESGRRNFKIFELLLEFGINLNIQNTNGQTALHFAYIRRHLDFFKLLLEKGANANILNKKNKNLLHYACELDWGDLKTVELLLNLGVDMNVQNYKGETALLLAYFNHSSEVVKLLLEKGGNPNICDNTGKNLIHYMNESKDQDLEMVEMLLNL